LHIKDVTVGPTPVVKIEGGSTNFLQLYNTYDPGLSFSAIQFASDSTNLDAIMGRISGSFGGVPNGTFGIDVALGQNNGFEFVVTPSGNVGIGVAIPQEKLHLSGAIIIAMQLLLPL